MSRIVDIAVRRFSAPLVQPFVTARRRATSLEGVLVSLRDDDGRVGWGEAATSWAVTGESAESVRAVVEGPIAEILRGADADDPGLVASIADAVVGNSAARAAVDTARWDLVAQRLDRPLARALGGDATPLAVRTDLTLSVAPVRELLDAARAGASFEALKVKVGPDAVASRDAVLSLRRELGATVRLRVDVNQGWSAQEAIAVIRHWEDAGADIEWVEQPTRAGDLAALASVTAATRTPILADEGVWDLDDLSALIDLRAADAINIKLAKCAGLTAALELARRAESAGIGVVVGTMLESAVGTAAGASVAAAVAPHAIHDLDGGLLTAASPVLGGPTSFGPTIELLDSPGLGIRGLAETVGVSA